MRKNTKTADQGVQEKAKKYSTDALVTKVFKVALKHFSTKEREDLRDKLSMALVLEIFEGQELYKELYDQHIDLMIEKDELAKKLIRAKAKNKRGIKTKVR